MDKGPILAYGVAPVCLLLIVAWLVSISIVPVSADTPSDCIKYQDDHLMKIQSNGGGCEYLVTSYMLKGWKLVSYIVSTGSDCNCDTYLLIKNVTPHQLSNNKVIKPINDQ